MYDTYQPRLKTIRFGSGRTAQLLEAYPTISANDLTKWLQLPDFRFSIVIHGGAMELTPEKRLFMQHFLRESVVRFAEDSQALVADGGTDTGIMQILGDAYLQANARFPLLGITVSNRITYPGGPTPGPERWALGQAHTHFVVVEGDDFGIESHILVGAARLTGSPGVALAINGGEITRAEIEIHARIGTPVIVFKGTGRYADALASAPTGSDLRRPFEEGGSLVVFDIETQPPEDLYHLMRHLLLR